MRWFAAALCALTACADGGVVVPVPGRTASLEIWNQSQYALLEVRLDDDPDYLDEGPISEQSLAVDNRLRYYGVGPLWVTVLREKYRGGPILALSTSEALQLVEKRDYLLEVLDESFRFTERGDRREPGEGEVFGVP